MVITKLLPFDLDDLLRFADEVIVFLDGVPSLVVDSSGTSRIKFFDKYLRNSHHIQVVMDNELVFESLGDDVLVDQRSYRYDL